MNARAVPDYRARGHISLDDGRLVILVEYRNLAVYVVMIENDGSVRAMSTNGISPGVGLYSDAIIAAMMYYIDNVLASPNPWYTQFQSITPDTLSD